MFLHTRAGNAIFTALEQSQEAIEITSEDQVIQVGFQSALTPLVAFVVSAAALAPSRSSSSFFLSPVLVPVRVL